MISIQDKTGFEALEQRVAAELGRELTAREKFHLAFSEACIESRAKQMTATELEVMARNEQQEIKHFQAEPIKAVSLSDEAILTSTIPRSDFRQLQAQVTIPIAAHHQQGSENRRKTLHCL
jgi:hypothetical protein